MNLPDIIVKNGEEYTRRGNRWWGPGAPMDEDDVKDLFLEHESGLKFADWITADGWKVDPRLTGGYIKYRAYSYSGDGLRDGDNQGREEIAASTVKELRRQWRIIAENILEGK